MEIDVMAIGAHPDDVEIGVGGTLAALVTAGKKVAIVDATDGEPTPYGSKELRQKESEEAARILGIHRRINLGLTNRELFDTPESRKALANVIRELAPKILLVPYWEDAHPDHVQLANLSEAARFYAKFVKSDLLHAPHYPQRVFHYYAMHLRAQIKPSFVFDTSLYEKQKIEAILAYRSQFIDNPHNKNVPDLIRTQDAYWGGQIMRACGEPLCCRENLRFCAAETLLNA